MPQRIPVVEQILNANDQLAAENRARLEQANVYGINIMASPGAGKTSLILKTIEALSGKLRLAVVEGDTAPVTIDADKISALGVPAVQVNTGGQCHMDAVMLRAALNQLDLSLVDLLIVENVGNLICPSSFQLGTHSSVLIASIPEGDDKPYKYPGIYRGLQALVINKTDLLPYVPFDMDYFRRGVEILNPGLVTFPLSCRTGEGLQAWIDWLQQAVK
ncbi:MAG TPA: hydrogenase nickel incorporation protein HypB [Anaerolineales bacterium]|nr:hydrogenase nickel incorporation protein HypB [Anaerolineales bacterium]